MQYIRAILRGLVRLLIVPAKLLWRSVHLAFGLILFAALITLLLGTYFSTDRDVAYRDVDPTSALCGFDLARESDIHGSNRGNAEASANRTKLDFTGAV